MVLKETNELIDWARLKLITEEENGDNNFYDNGYRLQKNITEKDTHLKLQQLGLSMPLIK